MKILVDMVAQCAYLLINETENNKQTGDQMNAAMIESGKRINTMDLNLRNAKIFSSETGNFLGEICGVVENYENNLFDRFDIPPCEFRRLGIGAGETIYFVTDSEGATYTRLLVMNDNGNTLAEQFSAAYTGNDFTVEDARAELACVCTEVSPNEFTFIDESTLTIR